MIVNLFLGADLCSVFRRSLLLAMDQRSRCKLVNSVEQSTVNLVFIGATSSAAQRGWLIASARDHELA